MSYIDCAKRERQRAMGVNSGSLVRPPRQLLNDLVPSSLSAGVIHRQWRSGRMSGIEFLPCEACIREASAR